MSQFDDADTLYQVIAKIFAVTVLLDKRRRDPELIEFTHACMVHNHALRPGKIVSRRQIMEWFDAHRPELEDALSKDNALAYKTELLSRVKTKDLQRKVLSSIFTISVSDYELHSEESDFINQALRVWKTSMPTPDELDAVA